MVDYIIPIGYEIILKTYRKSAKIRETYLEDISNKMAKSVNLQEEKKIHALLATDKTKECTKIP